MKNGKWRPWRPLLEQHSCTINASAVWSPDGDQVVYRSNPHGVIEIFKKKPKESGGQGMPYLSDETLRFDIEFSSLALSDWSIDRQSRESRILFSVPTRKGSGFDLWYASSAHGDRPKPWEFTDGIHSDQIHGSLSPDGRFLAYSSNESGRYEVYIQKLKSKDARTCVSKAPKHDGGSEPRWSRNGRELYYLSEYPRGLMAVSIDAEGEPGSPREISSPVAVPQSVNPLRTNYVPRKDGGFIVNILNPNSKVGSPSITIFTDWPSRIR
jgi:Tol biopolymer transport system component